MNSHPRLLIAGAAAAALLTGCTPGAIAVPTTAPPPTPAATVSPTTTTSPTSSPSSTPTVSPTTDWNAEQKKSVAAVEGYLRLSDKFLADPKGTSLYKMSNELFKYISGDMLEANIESYKALQKSGEHAEGTITTVWINPAEARDSKGRLWVNVCRDATARRWVSKDGTSKSGGMTLRQFSVRPGDGVHWKIYGEKAGEGVCE
ncbi:MAG: hypothetical protein LCH96_14715 [Actinobacteria bacterium]|nr:hypothetical protein [Actinomycetota bacterium]